MRIGELSRITGASARSLRHYEKLGLIESSREPNGYRDYDHAAVAAVRTIKELLALGFPTPLIEQILPCDGGAKGDCSALRDRITGIRDDIDEKVRQLTSTRETLTDYLTRVDG